MFSFNLVICLFKDDWLNVVISSIVDRMEDCEHGVTCKLMSLFEAALDNHYDKCFKIFVWLFYLPNVLIS